MNESNLLEKFKIVKKDIISLSEKKARNKGMQEQKLQELKEKFGVSSIDQAEIKLGEMAEKNESDEKILRTKLEELDIIVEKAEE
jgi:hypothetical protein